MRTHDPDTSLAIGALIGMLTLLIAVALALLATGHSPGVVPMSVAIAVPLLAIVLVIIAHDRRRPAH